MLLYDAVVAFNKASQTISDSCTANLFKCRFDTHAASFLERFLSIFFC